MFSKSTEYNSYQTRLYIVSCRGVVQLRVLLGFPLVSRTKIEARKSFLFTVISLVCIENNTWLFLPNTHKTRRFRSAGQCILSLRSF